MKFTPESTAACRARRESPSSTVPQAPPMAQAPKLIAETVMSVRPSFLYSMGSSAGPHPSRSGSEAKPGVQPRCMNRLAAMAALAVLLSPKAPPRPHILGISHVGLRVSSVGAARAFYEDFLGLRGM